MYTGDFQTKKAKRKKWFFESEKSHDELRRKRWEEDDTEQESSEDNWNVDTSTTQDNSQKSENPSQKAFDFMKNTAIDANTEPQKQTEPEDSSKETQREGTRIKETVKKFLHIDTANLIQIIYLTI